MNESVIKIKVPTLFYKDHQYRTPHSAGTVIKVGKLISEVEFTQEQFDDLLSDADYYASFKGSEDYEENKNIVDSAITTLKRLKAVK